MSGHEQIQKKLIDMAMGLLPENEKDALNSHLETCSDCNVFNKNLKKVLEATEQTAQISADEQLCEDAQNRLFDAIDFGQSKPSGHIDFGIWSKIMKNPIIKIAVAAVIFIAVVTAISVPVIISKNKPDNKETYVTNRGQNSTDIGTISTNDIKVREDLLAKAEAMFAAVDAEGLRETLKSGEYKAKIAAANYLAELGDVNSIELLEEIAKQYSNPAQAEPFTDAIALLSATTITDSNTLKSSVKPIVPDGFTINEILEVLPAETLFCLKFNKLDYGLMNMDQYLSGISPIPMAATMGIRMQLTKILADPTLAQINTVGDFAVFGLVKPGSEGKSPDDMEVAFLIPMKDYAKFIADNTNCSTADANGVSIITHPTGKAYIIKLGTYALLCEGGKYSSVLDVAAVLVNPVNSLSETLPETFVKNATQKPLWAYANIQNCDNIFGDMIQKEIEKNKNLLAKNQNQAGQPMPPEDIMNFYTGILDIITNEIELASISCEPTAQTINLQMDIKAIDGTPMAKMFATNQNKKPNQLLYFLEDDKLLNMAINMNSPLFEELSLTSYDIMSFMSDDISEETMAKTQELVKKMVSATGQGVWSFTITDSNQMGIQYTKDVNKISLCAGFDSNQPLGFSAEYIAEMRDADTYESVNEEIMKLWDTGGFGDTYSQSLGLDTGYTIEKDVETYKGVSIDSAFFKLSASDPNTDYGKLIDIIYGGGFKYYSAVTDGLYLCAFGTKSEKRIHELIDKVKEPGEKQITDGISNAMNLLGKAEQLDFFGTYNCSKHLGMATAFMPIENKPLLEQSVLESKSNLTFGGICYDGTLSFKVVMPKEHLLEVKKSFEALTKSIQQAEKEFQNQK